MNLKPLVVINKQSGNKNWQKITGSEKQLREISKIVRQPVKPPKDNQAAHIDRNYKPKREGSR